MTHPARPTPSPLARLGRLIPTSPVTLTALVPGLGSVTKAAIESEETTNQERATQGYLEEEHAVIHESWNYTLPERFRDVPPANERDGDAANASGDAGGPSSSLGVPLTVDEEEGMEFASVYTVLAQVKESRR